MPKASPLLSSFSAGELSPMLEGRADFEKYKSGCILLENYVVTVQGPVRMRIGTQYAGTANTTGDPAYMVPFEANTDAAFMLELGDGYMRFWYQRKRLVVYGADWGIDDGTGQPIAQLATPWTKADLVGEDGTLGVQFAQSNDVMWLVHPSRFPWKLTRVATYKFSGANLGDGVNANSPFRDQNITQSLTVYAGDIKGIGIPLTASGVVFTADMVGTYFYLEQPAADAIKPWQVAVAYALGDTVRSDGNNYVALNAATSGNVKPTHTSGAKFDGKTGVQWNWTDQGFGIVLITAVAANGLSATGTVLVNLPLTVKGAATPSFRWAKQAWNTTDGFPTAVQFFRGRLCFGRAQTFWMSVVGDFENFATTDGGVVTDDMAIIGAIGSDRNDRIRWFSAIGPLIVGTASGESSIQELTTSNPFSASNIQVTPQSGYGSRKIQPLRVQEVLLYVQRGGRRLRECLFDWSTQGYKSADLAALAQETVVGSKAVTGQSGIIAMAYQREPDQILWCVRGDGILLGFTYAKDHNVYAWHRHKIGGVYAGTTGVTLDYGIVRSVACIPAADNSTDDVYLAVTRTINGQPTTFVEVMGSHTSWASGSVYYYHDLPDVTEAFYLDCYLRGVVETSNSFTVPHLSNASAAGLVNGCVVPAQTLASSSFAVPANRVGQNIVVGCPYVATLKTMRIDAGAADGTSQGKLSKAQSVTVRLKDSLNLLYGPDENNLTREEFRKMGESQPRGALPDLGHANLLGWPEDLEKNYSAPAPAYGGIWSLNFNKVTANATTAPDGTVTADKITENSAVNGEHYNYQQFSGAVDLETRTLSCYFKAGERTAVYMSIICKDGTAIYAFANLTTGTLGSVGGANYVSSAISDAGNGWFRLSITGTMGVGGTTQAVRLQVSSGTTLGTQTYTGDLSDIFGIYAWGAKMESGALTDYAPVNGPIFRPGAPGAAGVSFDTAVPLFTGDRTFTWGGDWEEGTRVCLRQDQPLPSTILAIMPRMHVEDER